MLDNVIAHHEAVLEAWFRMSDDRSRRFAAVADRDRERREWAGKRALPSDTYRRGLRPLRSLDVEVPPAAGAHQTDAPFAK